MASSEPEHLDARRAEFVALSPEGVVSEANAPRGIELGELLLTEGIALSEQAQVDQEQALSVFELLASRLQGATDPRLRKLSVHAQIRTGIVLNRLGRFEEAIAANERIFFLGEPAIAALDEVAADIERRGGSFAREQLAWTLIARAAVIGQLQRRDETLAAVNDIIERFQNDDSPFIQGIVSMAREGREEVLAADEKA